MFMTLLNLAAWLFVIGLGLLALAAVLLGIGKILESIDDWYSDTAIGKFLDQQRWKYWKQ
jgi:hypothetical protein